METIIDKYRKPFFVDVLSQLGLKYSGNKLEQYNRIISITHIDNTLLTQKYKEWCIDKTIPINFSDKNPIIITCIVCNTIIEPIYDEKFGYRERSFTKPFDCRHYFCGKCYLRDKKCCNVCGYIPPKKIINPSPSIKINAQEKIARKSIPKRVRDLLWEKYGQPLCPICEHKKMSFSDFHCGHIISVYNSGGDDINNLRPICDKCNLSMGTDNMFEWCKSYFPKCKLLMSINPSIINLIDLDIAVNNDLTPSLIPTKQQCIDLISFD